MTKITEIINYVLGFLTSAQGVASMLGVSLVVAVRFVRTQIYAAIRRRQALADERHFGLDYTKVRTAVTSSALVPEGSLVSLRKIYSNRKLLIFKKLLEWQRGIAVEERERFVSGSQTFRLRDLLDDERIRIPVTLRASDTAAEQHTESIINALLQPLPSSVTKRLAILGDAGFGKSFICERVFDQVVFKTEDRLVLVIRPDDVEPLTDIGGQAFSLSALAQWVAKKALDDTRLELDLLIIRDFLQNNTILIVDGLDEILPRVPASLQQDVLESWIFAHTHLLTTRFWHYQYLRDRSNIFSSRTVATLLRLSRRDTRAFLQGALARTHTSDVPARVASCEACLERLSADSVDDASDGNAAWRTDPPAVAGTTPLLLMMLVEVSKTAFKDNLVETSVDIFAHFVHEMLMRELARDGAAEHETLARHFLQDVAWTVFAARGPNYRASLAIPQTDVDQRVLSYSTNTPQLIPTLRRLTSDSAFMRRRLRGIGGVELVGFTHQSFLEYFVSERLRDWILGQRASGSDFFDHLETPQVTVFIKEHFARIAQVPLLRRSAAKTLATQFEADMAARSSSTTEIERRRATFRVGQVIYHLAMSESPSHPMLMAALSDPSLWIQQAAAIGLAFGGHPDALENYINEMRSEIRAGNFSRAGAHIATQLAFYGDQDFDPLDPTRDHGLASCRRLVTRIVHELWLSAEAANWRVNLFDIVFLSKYRPCSHQSFLTALEEVKESLARVLILLAERHGRDKHPEINEVQSILEGRSVESL